MLNFLKLSTDESIARLKTATIALMCTIVSLQLGVKITPLFPEEKRTILLVLLCLLLLRNVYLLICTAIKNGLKIKIQSNNHEIAKIESEIIISTANTISRKNEYEKENTICTQKINTANSLITNVDSVFIYGASCILLYKTIHTFPLGYIINTLIILGAVIFFHATLNRLSVTKEIDAISSQKKKRAKKIKWARRN